jgi:hypothetical protein
MYFPRNWEFGSALSKLRNFGGGFESPLGTPLSPNGFVTGNSTEEITPFVVFGSLALQK